MIPFQRDPEWSLSVDEARAAGDGPAALVRLATSLQYAGQHDEGVVVFEDVLARSSEPAFARYEHFALQHLGTCLMEMERAPEALAAFHGAMALRIPLGDEGLIASTRRALDAAAGRSMVRVGVGAIVRRGAEILMARRVNVHGAGTWSTPGGHLEFGETPEACAARETLEETGVVVGGAQFLALTNDVLESDGRHYVTVWVACEHVSGDGAPIATHELDEVAWFRLDALPQPRFQPFDAMLASSAGEALVASIDTSPGHRRAHVS